MVGQKIIHDIKSQTIYDFYIYHGVIFSYQSLNQLLSICFPVRILNKTAYLLHCLIRKMTPRIARQTIAIMMNRYLFVLDMLLCLTSISFNVPKGIHRNDLSRRTRPKTIVRKLIRVSYEKMRANIM